MRHFARLGRIVPALLAVGVLLVVVAGPLAADESAPEPETKVIKMTAQNWKFTPDTIRVTKGTHVVIEFQSWDASHSFVLKAYRLKVPLPQDSEKTVEFVADKVGEFPFKCGRPCGDGCPKMRGTLIVVDE